MQCNKYIMNIIHSNNLRVQLVQGIDLIVYFPLNFQQSCQQLVLKSSWIFRLISKKMSRQVSLVIFLWMQYLCQDKFLRIRIFVWTNSYGSGSLGGQILTDQDLCLYIFLKVNHGSKCLRLDCSQVQSTTPC